MIRQLYLGGRSWAYDAEDDCLRFHPRHLPAVLAADLRTADGHPIAPVTSVNILEWHGREVMLRELDLHCTPM